MTIQGEFTIEGQPYRIVLEGVKVTWFTNETVEGAQIFETEDKAKEFYERLKKNSN
jgi:hypothetical protein